MPCLNELPPDTVLRIRVAADRVERVGVPPEVMGQPRFEVAK